MNERIKLLAEQAGCKVMDDGDWYIPSATGLEKIVYTKGIGLEKFAELIVRECATAFEAEVDTWKEMDPYQGSIKRQGTKAIKQHFGVEL